MDSHRRALGPIAIVAVVLAAWAGLAAGDIAPGAAVALALPGPAVVVFVMTIPRLRFDRRVLVRMVAAAVLSGGAAALFLAVIGTPPVILILLFGLLMPTAVALLASAPDLRPGTFVAVGVAAIVALWLVVGLIGWSQPDEGGRTFVVAQLAFTLIVTAIFMSFPALVVASTWLGLEWRASHSATR